MYRPIGKRKRFQMFMLITLLAWATQTLVHQWSRGAEVPPEPVERFVPGEGRGAVTLELRAESTVHGVEVRLKQVCRWSDADAAFFAPLADLVIARGKAGASFESVSLSQVRQTLHDAGVNLANVRFAGPTGCTVARSDVKYDEHSALQEWIDARQGKAQATPAGETPATAPAAHVTPRAATAPTSAPAARTLRDLLVADASSRLNVPVEQLQVNFNPADDKMLALAEPQFKFNLDPRRVHDLGDVGWEVQIVTDTGSKKVSISADVRAWQKQLVVNRPLAFHQVIREGDTTERKALVDRLPDDPLLTLSQAVGQQAARDLKPGTVLTSRLVDPVPLVKSGQFVTVSLAQGRIRVKTVGRAMDTGAFGETVRVRNESTNDVYDVVITGPQEATMNPTAANAE